MWKEIQGSKNWHDRLEPLCPLLREEIIRYGEFVSACYKACDLDTSSKRYSSCKHGKKNMFKEVGMEDCGYIITKYIYATTDISIPAKGGAWIGYIAVSSDKETKRLGRKDILVSFRGTVTSREWMANFMSSLSPARLDPNNPLPEVQVESGFLSLYTSVDSSSKFSQKSCREQVLSEMSRIINDEYKKGEMSITLAGHSMGSSLALLLGYDLAELGLNYEVPITVYSFGGPRVGNIGFKKRCEELGVKVLRVVNVNDPVTKLPGVFLNENLRVFGYENIELPWSRACYAHVGVELALNFFKMKNPAFVHDLEAYLGLLKFPKKKEKVIKKKTFRGRTAKEDNFVGSAWKSLLTLQNIDSWPWHDAARQVGNLVQSLGI
ncbi:hypothetical protein J5N97_022183 [Dioscorea zingiberensis]|uniref:Fungal lipase-type domain-containing protein n=1 Tax=Dioscorea zingiberensis TaxID=325984 RepID=A0A9D5C9J9_9LILI|nr:hypothetical protein J5N97_022183 [Dioscorea zingiberensis]